MVRFAPKDWALYGLLSSPRVYDIIQKLSLVGRKRMLRTIEELIEAHVRGKVLDIGCGTGRYAHLFGKNYFGVDIIPDYLINKSRQGRQFVCGNATGLPFKDRSFDSVFSVVFFHHVDLKSSEEVFREIVRVSDGGAAVLIVDCFQPETKLDVPGRIISALDRGKFVKNRNAFMDKLRRYFDILQVRHIDYSYPYNIYAFIARTKT